MKPIQLTIAGLQSYRAKQEIDFTRLCDAGVFGIFGPTGSGKSTILDAMTLALYGEVERASGGTQGILNHAENTLSVSFTFELSSSSGWERYRVDRQYKRNGETSLLQTVSRFVRLGASESESGRDQALEPDQAVVLADKSKEVTKAVEDTIGLSMHDFTRAVVLPQGKFAEFLSLKHSERRQMLQRLFALEAYGDKLNARLSSRMKATDVRLKQTVAEQQGLGDASADALHNAASRLHAAKETARTQRERLQTTQARRDALKQRWDWQLEREQLERELAKLASREDAVALWERSLVLADAAERLLPFLREREETARRSADASREQAAAAEGLAGASRGHNAAAEAHAAAQQALLAGEAGLSVRLERLRQALALQQELQRLAADVAQLSATREQAAGTLAADTARLRQQTELRVRAQQKQAELQEQLQRLEAPAGHRHKLQAAALDKQQLAAAERHAAELAAEAAGSAQALERLQQQRRELATREAAHGEQLAADAAGAAGEREALRRLALEASRLQAAVQAALAEQQRQQRERETARLAAHLAASLADGEPCPVCGSHEHPRLGGGEQAPAAHGAEPTASEAEEDARLSEELELLRDPLQQLQFRLLQHGSKLDELATQWEGWPQAGPTDAYAEAATSLATDPDSRPAASGEAAGHSHLSVSPALDLRPAATGEAPGSMHLSTAPDLRPAAPGEAPDRSHLSALTAPGEAPGNLHLPALTAADIHSAVLQATAPNLPLAVAALVEQANTAATRLTHIEEAFKRAQQQRRQQELQQNELVARLDAAQAAAIAATEKLQAARTQVNKLQATWVERYIEWTVEQVDPFIALLAEQDKQVEELKERIAKSIPFLESTVKQIEELHVQTTQVDKELAQLDAQLEARKQAVQEKAVQLRERAEGDDVAALMLETQQQLDTIRSSEQAAREQVSLTQSAMQISMDRHSTAVESKRSTAIAAEKAEAGWQAALQTTVFTSQQEVEKARLPEEERSNRLASINTHREQETKLKLKVQSLQEQLQGSVITEEQWNSCVAEWVAAREQDEIALQEAAKAERDLEDMEAKHLKWSELQRARVELESQISRLTKLQSVLRGNAFVEYVAEEQLIVVSRAASQRLGDLTGQRYAIEVDSSGGFLIRDDANGGVRRPVSTLSGGETFLASLALALALSAQIQLRGRYPLEFFFLDEGFGTLDQELLESVIAALEKLHMERLTVGVISHVPELRARLPRRLIVQPAAAAGEGSQVSVESG